MLGLVVVMGCGRVDFAQSASCSLTPLGASFVTEIDAWNATGDHNSIDMIDAYDAACAADVGFVAAQLPAHAGDPTDLDWSGALDSYFFRSSTSDYGPMLAVRIDEFLIAGGTATATEYRDGSGERADYRLVVFAETSGLAVVIDGRRRDD